MQQINFQPSVSFSQIQIGEQFRTIDNVVMPSREFVKIEEFVGQDCKTRQKFVFGQYDLVLQTN